MWLRSLMWSFFYSAAWFMCGWMICKLNSCVWVSNSSWVYVPYAILNGILVKYKNNSSSLTPRFCAQNDLPGLSPGMKLDFMNLIPCFYLRGLGKSWVRQQRSEDSEVSEHIFFNVVFVRRANVPLARNARAPSKLAPLTRGVISAVGCMTRQASTHSHTDRNTSR